MYVLYGIIVPVDSEKDANHIECEISTAIQRTELDLSKAYYMHGRPTLDDISNPDKFCDDVIKFFTDYKN